MKETERAARTIFATLEEAMQSAIAVNGENKIKHLMAKSENGYVFCTGKEQAYQTMLCFIGQMKKEYGVDSDETVTG